MWEEILHQLVVYERNGERLQVVALEVNLRVLTQQGSKDGSQCSKSEKGASHFEINNKHFW